MGKRILVTGGAGFIGSAVLAQLQHEEYEVMVIDNLSFGNRAFINLPDSHFAEQNILDEAAVKTVFQSFKPEILVHLAAIHFIPYCNQHPFESANINLKGTLNVLTAAKQCSSVEKIFFASTAAVYPIFDGPLAETHPAEPSDIYGLSKLMGENLVNEFHLQTSIPAIVCRFFNAFGPNETNPHLIPEIERQLNAGQRQIALGNLEPKRDFIHTHDMAKAVSALLQKFQKGIDTFNLGRGIEYSVLEIVEAFERQLGEKITVVQDPARIRKVDRGHLLADIGKLKAFTGWQPATGIDEGIKTLLTTSHA